ncbi:carboxypeptidase-like regulatory domain-containing protein [Prolixibacteraceae bacterium JC049]|nr:carboxypeptidase-like regulatory domain-containing protein [Prolixibacteraceae bacterium JC049]
MILRIGIGWIILLLSMSLGWAQEKSAVKISGQVIDGENTQPVPFAYVIIPRLEVGTVADENGFFEIRLPEQDSIKVSAMGFANSYFKHKGSSATTDTTIVIPMFKTSYGVDEVVVEGERRMDLRLPQGKASTVPVPLRGDAFDSKPKVWNYLVNPLSTAHYYLSRKERSKRKVRAAMEQQKNWEALREFYNDEVITEITGLPSTEIERFVMFCNPYFSLDSTYTELTIKNRIGQVYKQYLLQKGTK